MAEERQPFLLKKSKRNILFFSHKRCYIINTWKMLSKMIWNKIIEERSLGGMEMGLLDRLRIFHGCEGQGRSHFLLSCTRDICVRKYFALGQKIREISKISYSILFLHKKDFFRQRGKRHFIILYNHLNSKLAIKM